MKTFTQTILKAAFAFAFLLGGMAFAHAADAAQFDSNPSDNTGITSIAEGNCFDCGGQSTSVSASSINQPGQTMFVTVFTDFMARRGTNQTVDNARGKYNVKNLNNQSAPTFSFGSTLTADNAANVSDSVTVTNLPSSYKIEFNTGYIRNEHGGSNGCHPNYNYNFSVTPGSDRGVFSPNGAFLGDLDNTNNGYCGQGTIGLEYKITNTEATAPNLSVVTNNADNIENDSARLKGTLVSGQNAGVWFAITTGSTPNCSSSSQRVNVSGLYDGNESFSATAQNLQSNTRYSYRACAEQGNQDAQGQILNFTTDQVTTNFSYDWQTGSYGACDLNGERTRTVVCKENPGNTTVPDSQCLRNGAGPKPQTTTTEGCGIVNERFAVETRNATNISQQSATLNGVVRAGQTDYVYFVLESNNSNPSCQTSQTYFPNDFQNPRSAGDSFEYNFFANGNPLSVDTNYYYRACAQNGNGVVASGNVVQFRTDDDGGTGGNDQEPEADTQSARDIDEDSAELRGNVDMNDFDNGIVFFVYGQDQDRVNDVENDYNSYNDVENDEDNDEFEVERVDTDLDGSEDYERNVSGLDEDERYYFQICVEFDNDNGNSELECGGVEDFETDREDIDDDEEIDIRTESPRSVTQTSAEMCGRLVNDGGESRQTWIEFRQTNDNSFTQTPPRQRGEVEYCERVTGLTPGTNYIYRACTNGECGTTRTFRTAINTPQGAEPIAVTEAATDISSIFALLRGTYISNADRATVWFNYGRTQSLGRETVRQNVSGNFGVYSHSFTGLSASTTYFYQAAIQTQNGFDTGAIFSFRTDARGIVIPGPPRPPIVVVPDDDLDIDLSSLGLGLSLVRLEIDDSQEIVTEGESLQYLIEWENISDLDLFDLNLKIVMPPEIIVTDISRGRFDADENIIYYTISDLEADESGSLTVSGIVDAGIIGNLITADAELAYDNPINDAQENAFDFDVDEYGLQIAGVTASVFGLANITFLGWLVILLGLFIIFLVARWLYLEREEMRAQAYATGGYGVYPAAVAAPRYDYNQPPQMAAPQYNEQPRYDQMPQAPAAPAQRNDYYEPYRPNRG